MQDKICLVKNRSAGTVSYRIPEDGIRRLFQPGEVKKIAASELEKLTFQLGGRELIFDYLQISESDVVNNLNIPVEPEYWMSERQVQELMTNGSLDAFKDALDFAPSGVLDLIKRYAVEMPLNDSAKRIALKEKTGFDVTKALVNIQAEQEEGKKQVEAPQRRVQPQDAETKPGRRTTTNYKVVSTNK